MKDGTCNVESAPLVFISVTDHAGKFSISYFTQKKNIFSLTA